MARHNIIGEIGEEIAMKHLMKHGFSIIDRNYRKKWGEIDIIAEKGNVLHFVEVKTVSYETDFENYIPEENVNYSKRKKLSRVINTYLSEQKLFTPPNGGAGETGSGGLEFQIDVIAVFFDYLTKKSKIRVLEDVVFD